MVWNENFARLERYVAQHGTSRLPKDTVFEGSKLGNWVRHQRVRYQQGKLSDERITKLVSLPRWRRPRK